MSPKRCTKCVCVCRPSRCPADSDAFVPWLYCVAILCVLLSPRPPLLSSRVFTIVVRTYVRSWWRLKTPLSNVTSSPFPLVDLVCKFHLIFGARMLAPHWTEAVEIYSNLIRHRSAPLAGSGHQQATKAALYGYISYILHVNLVYSYTVSMYSISL